MRSRTSGATVGRPFFGARSAAGRGPDSQRPGRLSWRTERGRRLLETNRQELIILGGLDANLEETTDPDDAGQVSLEEFASLQYARFLYHHPKQNFSTVLMVFPSLTVSGRFRAQFNTDWRQEIVRNFFFEITLFATYDNEPPEGALLSTDYEVVTSLGYSFSP